MFWKKFKIAKLLPIPLALIIFSLIVIFNHYLKTGDFFIKDIDLKGGTSVTLFFNQSINTENLEEILRQQYENLFFSYSKTSEGTIAVNFVTDSIVNSSSLISFLNEKGFYPQDHSIQFVGPELGKSFFVQITNLLIIAYVFLFLLNLIIYKKPVIAVTIILSSVANLICVFGIMTFFNQRFSFAGFSSLLMLIAFGIDANVILATKILSGKIEEFYDQYKKGLITGITINSGLIISMLIVLFLSNSNLLINIAEIQIIGFFADILNTWILNAAIIEVILLGKRH
jgi:preprotein translocase subunit SecF